MNILGIIPARGGSKGVKGKNIRIIDGKPLITYTIEAGQESRFINQLVVDTDSRQIAEVAAATGVRVIHRPAELAQDDSSVVDVVLRIINLLSEEKSIYDLVVLLQPTSPIKTGKNIDEAIELILTDESTDAIISVVPMEDTHPARMYDLNKNKELIALHPDLESKRRQDLKPVYYRNGCIYVVRVKALVAQRTFMPGKKKGYVMPAEWLANIDDERDLIITEALLKAWKEGRI